MGHNADGPVIQAADEILPGVTLPPVGLRGKFVVVTSELPVIDTLKLNRPRDDHWYFVCQDSQDK